MAKKKKKKQSNKSRTYAVRLPKETSFERLFYKRIAAFGSRSSYIRWVISEDLKKMAQV